MRKLKQLLLVLGVFMFVGGTALQAQDVKSVTGAVKKQEKELQDKKDKEAAKLKEKGNTVKGDANAAYDDAKGGTMSGGATNEKIEILREKLSKARTDKERQEIKKMIEREMKVAKKDAGGKIDDAKNDASTAIGNAKDDANASISASREDSDAVTGIVTNDGNGTASSDVVGKEINKGRARSKAARAKISKGEKDLAQKMALVENGRARIAAAKERLAAGKADGSFSEDQIVKKQATIDKVEARVDRLEKSINNGKTVYAKQKASLNTLVEN